MGFWNIELRARMGVHVEPNHRESNFVRTKFLLKTPFRLLKNLIKNKNNKNNRRGGAEFLCKHYPPT